MANKIKKIKVLRVLSRLNIGGPSIHTILLSSKLNKNRFQSILAVGIEGINEGNMLNLAAEKSVEPICIPQMGREISLIKDIISIKEIFLLLVKEKPDIVHTHAAKAGFLGRISVIIFNFIFLGIFNIQKSKIKVFHTFHGNVFKGYFGKSKSIIFLYIEKFLAMFTIKIICITEMQKKELYDFGLAKYNKLTTIPLGLELKNFLSTNNYLRQLRIELGISDNTIVFGVIARLVPIKNHMLFLKAIMNLLNQNIKYDIRVIIVGDGENRIKLEKFVKRNNLSDFIYFLGFRHDLEKIYTALDVVVLCSRNEGTPVALIEAMASNLPVISTNVGGVGDLLGVGKIKINLNEYVVLDCGIIVNSEDHIGLSNAMKYMLYKPEKRKLMGRNSKKMVFPKYDISRLCRNIESLYLNHLHSNND